MENRILKIALGALILAGLGFAGYRYMQSRDNVEIQQHLDSFSVVSPDGVDIQSYPRGYGNVDVQTQSYDDDSMDDDDQAEMQSYDDDSMNDDDQAEIQSYSTLHNSNEPGADVEIQDYDEDDLMEDDQE